MLIGIAGFFFVDCQPEGSTSEARQANSAGTDPLPDRTPTGLLGPLGQGFDAPAGMCRGKGL